MKDLFFLLMISFLWNCTQNTQHEEARLIILNLLENTHSEQNWFVPSQTAIANLNEDQVSKRDSNNNNSIKEIVSHLIFWNEKQLEAFTGENLTEYSGRNELTFQSNRDMDWNSMIDRLDSIQAKWEDNVRNASAGQLESWTKEVANMAAHTAYHTGQIIYIRKMNGWWK